MTYIFHCNDGLGIMGMHKIGGFRYAGLDKKVLNYTEKELANFKAKHAAGLLGTNKKLTQIRIKTLGCCIRCKKY